MPYAAKHMSLGTTHKLRYFVREKPVPHFSLEQKMAV